VSALSVAEVLDAAADLIEPEGAWTQGEWGSDGCWCLDGALMAAKGSCQTWPELEAVRNAIGPECETAIGWNDAPERTQAEVVAKLREAAAKAKEQGL
jgi:hypothetical protein